MGDSVDFIVIGRGMMGSACARHLAEAGARVALVGPDEPTDRSTHDGPFGSHHDAGRITRAVADDADWATLSLRSIARYRDLEEQSGLPFYTACGGVMAGPDTVDGRSFADSFLNVARSLDLAHEVLDQKTLAARMPWFDLPQGARAAFDPVGGYINPRALRDAQSMLAERAGARLIRHAAVGLAGDTVTLADGTNFSGGHVVVATGGYAATDTLLPARPAMRVMARTVAFAEVAEDEAARLSEMPTLIYMPQTLDYTLYVLPPIRYPDGKLYIKIGGEDDSPRLTDDKGMTDWFRSPGSVAAADILLGHLKDLMPTLAVRSTHTDSCAVTFTETDFPYIARLDKRLTLLTGGNGAGAKCCDELGRLGALMAQTGRVTGEGYSTDFRAVLT